MPIYEYRCKSCDQTMEVLCRSGRDEEDLSCSGCGSQELERQFSCFSSASGSPKGADSQSTGCRPSSGFR